MTKFDFQISLRSSLQHIQTILIFILMYKSINRFGPLVSVLALATVPFLAWRKNLGLNQKIKGKDWQSFRRPYITKRGLSYPWCQDIEEWEGMRIKMEGYFEEERFLVSREKDGKKGCLVFAPFIYRHEQLKPTNRGEKTPRDIVIVCLGWVPTHLKETVSMNYDQTQLIEYSQQTHPGFLQVNDGFNRDPNSETSYMPLTYITGIIRKGETKDVTRGLNNWPLRHYYRMIDLFHIAKAFRLPNIHDTSQAYIQLIAETQDERASMPIPNTPEDIIHQYSASRVPYFRWLRENLVSPAVEVVGKLIV